MTEEEKQEIIERNKYLNSMSYEDKVKWAEYRIEEWAEICEENGKNYAVSVGGLDSITLLIFVRKVLGDHVRGVSVSSLEDMSIQRVHKKLGVERIASTMGMTKVLNNVGFPIFSKGLADDLEHLQIPPEEADYRKTYYNHALMTGETGPWGKFRKSEHMKLDDNILELFGGAWASHRPDLQCKCAPFKVSAQCCKIMKEGPLHEWQEKNNVWPFLGMMQVEGGQRRYSLRKYGCNYVGKNTARSCPLNHFSRQDLLQLVLDLDVPVPEIYGTIERDKKGKLRTTKAQRTGCVMCGFGLHLEKRPHRFDRIYYADPKKWNFWMNNCCTDEAGDKYGWGRVCDYVGIEWRDPERFIPTDGQIPGQMSIQDFLGGEQCHT